MARPNRVSKSEKLRDGVCVWFGDGFDDEAYYAHGIHKWGDKDSNDADDSAWGWRNHMSHKVWWSEGIERDFFAEVKKYL